MDEIDALFDEYEAEVELQVTKAVTLDLADTPTKSNSEIITEVFGALDAVRGAKAKVEVLKDLQNIYPPDAIRLLSKILRYAYDDEIRYGIGKQAVEVPLTVSYETRDFDDWVFTKLDEVIMEPSTNKKSEILTDLCRELSAEDVELVANIIGKDLRIGVNQSTINKAIPGLLSEFDVMLAKPFTEKLAKFPSMVEPKLDGMRVVAIVRPGVRDCVFYTRSGKTIPSLSDYADEMIAFAKEFTETGAVAFDGEVTSGTFLESISEIRSGSSKVTDGTFHAFDVLVRSTAFSPIALKDEELEEQGTQRERRKRLMDGYASFKRVYEPKFVKPTASYVAGDADEVARLYTNHRDAGYEGVIVKDPNAFYVKKRSAAWLKMKAEESLDLPIIGAFEGEGQFQGQMGGLIVDHNGVMVRVGSGFSATQRADYWEQLKRDLDLQDQGRFSERVLLGNLAEVQFQEIMPSGSLRHPVFKRLRTDKAAGIGSF